MSSTCNEKFHYVLSRLLRDYPKFQKSSIRTFLQNYIGKVLDAEFNWLKPLKIVKWNFICLGIQSDGYFTRAVATYQKLLDYTGIKGIKDNFLRQDLLKTARILMKTIPMNC
ncbi:integrator complex subunit 14-like [Glossina fuscipes fuscipes]